METCVPEWIQVNVKVVLFSAVRTHINSQCYLLLSSGMLHCVACYICTAGSNFHSQFDDLTTDK